MLIQSEDVDEAYYEQSANRLAKWGPLRLTAQLPLA
jgi:hypothetical protein